MMHLTEGHSDKTNLLLFGRVGKWRGGLGRGLFSLFTHPFVCECHNISTLLRFHIPALQTGHADFPHPAFGQAFMRSPTVSCACSFPSAEAQVPRTDTHPNTSWYLHLEPCAYSATIDEAFSECEHPQPGRLCLQGLG